MTQVIRSRRSRWKMWVDPARPTGAESSLALQVVERMSPPEAAAADQDGPTGDAGMSTVEYAVGTVVAAAFAAVLYKIVTGDSVVAGLTDLVNSALHTAL